MATMSTSASRKQERPVLCPLADTGLIEVTGADAVAFLNAQLSRNVDAGRPLRATLAGWHDAKGRVLAVLWALWLGDRWLLLVKGTDAEDLLRRLSMYVLRADVRLRNACEGWRAVAVVGRTDASEETLFASLGANPCDAAAGADGTYAIRIGPRLAYVIAPCGNLRAIDDLFASGSAETAAIKEIRLGLVSLVPELAGRYTAHMLNLDRLGAVSFDKGCYPGQEIIARTQNLGSAKRRLFRYSGPLEQVPSVGSALLDAGGTRVGEVVRAAADDDRGIELLAVVRVDAASDSLFCADADRLPLTRRHLSGQ